MSNFSFYTANEVYAEKYFQLPKVFFTNEKYKKMSNDSKIAYAILKDRFSYSVKNNWIDEQNRIYFVFTVEELKNILNCAEGKISKIKKELVEMNLLFQERGGLTWVNGAKVNTPNKLYLGKPEATAEDVFLIDSAEIQAFHGFAKIANPEKSQSNNKNYGIAKIANPQEVSNSKGSSGIAEIADNLFYSSLDTNRHMKDTEETNKPDLQNQALLENFETLMSDRSNPTFVPKRCLGLIRTFSNTFEEAEQTLKAIHNAKRQAQKEFGHTIVFEEAVSCKGTSAEVELYNTLLRAYQKQKHESIKNMQNWIFSCVKNMFIEQFTVSRVSTEELPNISLHNWLEDYENRQNE